MTTMAIIMIMIIMVMMIMITTKVIIIMTIAMITMATIMSIMSMMDDDDDNDDDDNDDHDDNDDDDEIVVVKMTMAIITSAEVLEDDGLEFRRLGIGRAAPRARILYVKDQYRREKGGRRESRSLYKFYFVDLLCKSGQYLGSFFDRAIS